MAAVIRPFAPLHVAIEQVLQCATDHIDAVQHCDIEDLTRSYLALEAAVEFLVRAREAHAATTDSIGAPRPAVLAGGLSS